MILNDYDPVEVQELSERVIVDWFTQTFTKTLSTYFSGEYVSFLNSS